MSWWDSFTEFVSNTAVRMNPFLSSVADTSAAVNAVQTGQGYTPGQGTFNDVTNAVGPAMDVSQRYLYTPTNQLVSWIASAAPGGSPTLDWDRAAEVPMGQAATSMLAGFAPNMWFQSDQSRQDISKASEEMLAGQARFVVPVDLNDAEKRQKAYEDSLAGRAVSGVTDFALSWYLDPLVIGGKALKISREGSQILSNTDFMGTTNRVIRSPKQAVLAGKEIDDHALWVRTNGAEGRQTALGQFLQDSVERDAATLRNEPLLGKSYARDLNAAVLGENKDPLVAFAYGKAMIGLKGGRDELAALRPDLDDALTRWTEFRDTTQKYIEELPLGAANSDAYLFQAQQNMEYADRLVKAYQAQDKVFDHAMRALDQNGTWGSVKFIGPSTVEGRARDAKYAQWKSDMQYGPIVPDTSDVTVRVFQNNWWDRAVHVYDWAGDTVNKAVRGFTRQRPTYYVTVNGLGAQRASDEIIAILNDVPALKNADGFKRDIMNRFIEPLNGTADDRMRAVLQIEEEIVTFMTRQKFGSEWSVENARKIVSEYQKHRSALVKDMSNNVTRIDVDQNPVLGSPLLRSQLANKMPIMDFGYIDEIMTRHQSVLAEKWHTVADPVSAFMDSANSLWKTSVLLRLGYPVRNVAEGAMRVAAVYGWFPMFDDLGGAMKRWTRNRNLWAVEQKSKAADLIHRRSPSIVQHRILSLDDTLAAHRNALAKAENKLASKKRKNVARMRRYEREAAKTDSELTPPMFYDIGNTEARVAGLRQQVAELEAQRAELVSDLAHVQARRDAAKKARKQGKRGSGTDEAFNIYDPFSAVAREESSAGGPVNTLMGNVADPWLTVERDNWIKIAPEDPGYWESLHRAGNELYNDPAAKMFLQGRSLNDTVDWARSAEAKWWRADFGLRTDQDVAGHVALVRRMVDQYFPDESIRRRMAAGDLPTPADLQVALSNRQDIALSAIHGEKMTSKHGAVVSVLEHVKSWQQTGFKWIGTLPEDAALRHPFYNRLYQTRRADLSAIARSEGLEPKWTERGLPANEVANRIERASHNFAISETKSVLFTLERYGNVSAMLRWLSPFFAAQSNTIRTWGKIAYRDPSVAARAALIWNAPNRAGIVVDSEGDPIPDEGVLGLLGGAGSIKTPFGVGQMDMYIPKSGVNVAFQGGSPLLPSLGPLPSVLPQVLISDKPELEATLKEGMTRFGVPQHIADQVYESIIPFGQPNADISELFIPAWVKRARTLFGPDSDAEFSATVNQIYRNNLQEWEANGRPGKAPTTTQAAEQARKYYAFRVMANLTLPVSPQFKPHDQFYLDQYRALTKQYGFEDGEVMFINKYPEFFRVTESSARNTTGMRSSQDAYNAQRANQELFAEIVGIDPGLGWMVTNPDWSSAYEFSPAVREWQRNNSNAPGSSENFYDPRSAEDTETAAQAERGWRDYTRNVQIRDDMLAQRGLKSIMDPGAEDIRTAWRAWVAEFRADPANLAWATEYDTHATDANTRMRITALTKMVTDQGYVAYMQRTGQGAMVTAMEDYLRNRKKVIAVLQERAAAGGSGSITAQSNADVERAWDVYVQGLRYSSVGWGAFYDRVLEKDTLVQVEVN